MNKAVSPTTIEVATDVGGTFTDIVCYTRGADGSDTLSFGKVHTTPPDFDRGVLQALSKLEVDRSKLSLFIHGSTVVINALTERRGVKVGFITTRGFRDVLLIGRANRPDLYNIQYKKPEAFIERHQCAEITERLDHEGKVLAAPDLSELPPIIAKFREDGVKAIGICLLHAYANPAHEVEVRKAVAELWPEAYIVASHEICQEWREFERSSTTVLSAYVKPAVDHYLNKLENSLENDGFAGRAYVMQSNGGLSNFDAGRSNPISLVESGPAAGMFGALAWGRQIGETNLLALDIGGTTAKCTLIDGGRVPLVTDYRIERSRSTPGHPIKTPVVDIVEIGTGGGSIASVDVGGRLQVGPRSAGAVPGPIAYGQGGSELTTTDANLWTGRINATRFAGGEMTPAMPALARALEAMGARLNVTESEVARGILRVANANMVNALKLVSVNRGHDPQDFPLIAFGGGGPLHAAFLAHELRMRRVIIPPQPAVFSAWGMLLSDARRDYFKTAVVPLSAEGLKDIGHLFNELEQSALEDLSGEMMEGRHLETERAFEARYSGQEHSLRIDCTLDDLTTPGSATLLIDRFHAAHEREFTFRLGTPIVIVGVHLAARVPSGRKAITAGTPLQGSNEPDAKRMVDFDVFGIHEAAQYDRSALGEGATVEGPALIEEANTVTVIPPGFTATIDGFANIIIHCPVAEEA